MTCVDTQIRFRLLDGNVGWDPWYVPRNAGDADSTYASGPGSREPRGTDSDVIGLYDSYGLRLNNRGEPRISSQVLSPFMPPAWLAVGCRPGEWFLCGGEAEEAVLLQRDPCRSRWINLQESLADGESLQQPIAVAAMRHRLAVIDKHGDSHRVIIWSIPDGRLAGMITLPREQTPYAVAFSAWREVIVAVEDAQDDRCLHRYDLVGLYRGSIEIRDASVTDPLKSLVRLQTARNGSLWAAESANGRNGPFHLWQIAPAEPSGGPDCARRVGFDVKRMTDVDFYHDVTNRLERAFRPTRLVSVGSRHFCIDEPTPEGMVERQCYDRMGAVLSAAPPDDLLPTRPEPPHGVLVTKAIDSFIPRCRWHRVRIDAELPPDTSYQLEFATSEIKQIPVQDVGNSAEQSTKAKPRPFRPDADDWTWQLVDPNATDILLDQPAGRYLFVRVRLTGTTHTTPVIRRMRIDFPRATSLDQLPAVYRDNADAEDFTERFLSLFDAATTGMDRAIERFPALFDPDGVPEEVLSWLGSFVGIVSDSEWNVGLRRELIKAAPRLYRKRGTVAGLQEAIALICGFDEPGQIVIDEHAHRRAWGVVSQNARLGSVRLFGRSESRLRVGRSPLGVAPLRSFGNPDHDPVRQDAYRFTVLMPSTPALTRFGVDSLNRLIEHQKPAHTQHQVRIGGQGFVLGHRSAIGIDTQFVPPSPVVLRAREDLDHSGVRLGAGVLRPGPNRPTSGLRPGVASSIGIHTTLE